MPAGAILAAGAIAAAGPDFEAAGPDFKADGPDFRGPCGASGGTNLPHKGPRGPFGALGCINLPPKGPMGSRHGPHWALWPLVFLNPP